MSINTIKLQAELYQRGYKDLQLVQKNYNERFRGATDRAYFCGIYKNLDLQEMWNAKCQEYIEILEFLKETNINKRA